MPDRPKYSPSSSFPSSISISSCSSLWKGDPSLLLLLSREAHTYTHNSLPLPIFSSPPSSPAISSSGSNFAKCAHFSGDRVSAEKERDFVDGLLHSWKKRQGGVCSHFRCCFLTRENPKLVNASPRPPPRPRGGKKTDLEEERKRKKKKKRRRRRRKGKGHRGVSPSPLPSQ